HGYTGSTDGFRELAKVLSSTLDAYVSAPLLPGHGTTLDELQNISFDQFLDAARVHARDIASLNKPLAIVGYCFGGYLATLLADEFRPSVLALGLTTYKPRFPFWLPG